MESPAACKIETIENGRILLVTLNSPPDNLVTQEMLASLDAAITIWQANPGPDLAIITGQGNVFSKGFEVGQIRSHVDPLRHRHALLLANDLFSRLACSPRPVLAAVNGACLGAGLELALACHFRICVEQARFGLPELWKQVIPGFGGVYRLAKLVGRSRALDLIAVGNLLPAAEALQWGLVNRVVARKNLMEAVLSIAKAILSVDQQLVGEIMRLTALAESRGEQDVLAQTIDSVMKQGRTR